MTSHSASRSDQMSSPSWRPAVPDTSCVLFIGDWKEEFEQRLRSLQPSLQRETSQEERFIIVHCVTHHESSTTQSLQEINIYTAIYIFNTTFTLSDRVPASFNLPYLMWCLSDQTVDRSTPALHYHVILCTPRARSASRGGCQRDVLQVLKNN